MTKELKRAAANRSVDKVTEMPSRDGYTRRSFSEMSGRGLTWIVTDDLSGIDDPSSAIGTSAVVVLKNAGEVIELCRIGETQPHLVIADLDMRCTSGLILAALVRNHFPGCKLWLLSEHAEGIRQSLCRFSTLAHAQIVRKPLCLLGGQIVNWSGGNILNR